MCVGGGYFLLWPKGQKLKSYHGRLCQISKYRIVFQRINIILYCDETSDTHGLLASESKHSHPRWRAHREDQYRLSGVALLISLYCNELWESWDPHIIFDLSLSPTAKISCVGSRVDPINKAENLADLSLLLLHLVCMKVPRQTAGTLQCECVWGSVEPFSGIYTQLDWDQVDCINT